MKIDTGAIKSKTKGLSTNISSVKNEINSLKKSVSDIEGAWKGKKATEFVDNLNTSYISELNELEGILEDYNDFLSKVPRAYEMLDEQYGNKNINV